jgi:hypothetical protein
MPKDRAPGCNSKPQDEGRRFLGSWGHHSVNGVIHPFTNPLTSLDSVSLGLWTTATATSDHEQDQ